MDRREKVVTLQHPIEAHGETITELKLREPRVRDVRKALRGAEGETDTACRLIAQLADVPPSTVDELRLDDFVACSQALTELLPAGLRGEVGAAAESEA